MEYQSGVLKTASLPCGGGFFDLMKRLFKYLSPLMVKVEEQLL